MGKTFPNRAAAVAYLRKAAAHRSMGHDAGCSWHADADRDALTAFDRSGSCTRCNAWRRLGCYTVRQILDRGQL